jgi:DNA-binding NarL/FixJ family response regulator
MGLRILLVNSHPPIVCQSLKNLLHREGFEVVGAARDICEALRLTGELAPEIVVLDLVASRLSCLNLAIEIIRAFPEKKLLLLASGIEDYFITIALQTGIRGYLLKTRVVEELVGAIHQISKGGFYLSPGISPAAV